MNIGRYILSKIEEKVEELADDFQTTIVGTLSHSEQVILAEEQKKTLLECYPESKMAEEYRVLARQIYRICGEGI